MKYLKQIIKRKLESIMLDCYRANGWIKEPDMNFQRRVAVKEAIFNISTATRYETESDQNPNSLKGDYMEFGVFQGAMFKFVLSEAGGKMPWMRFFACDSFEGLPKPKGIDANAEFVEGQFSCPENEFMKNISGHSIDKDRIITVSGWFDNSLKEENVAKHQIKIVSLAYVDCDFYESCVPVLSFLTTRVRGGTIIMFDDWFCFKSDPNRGIQLAVSEWLKKNQNIELIPWQSFSSHGKSFFVNLH